MASVVIQGDTSGAITLQAPSVAGTNTINLPSTLGNTGTSAFATTDSAGNLGLGVTPSYKLDVSGTARFNNTFDFGAGQAITSGSGAYRAAKFGAASGAYNVLFAGTTSFQINDSADTTNLLVLTNGGNLGVGTTSPFGKLNVSNGGAAGFEFFTNFIGGGAGTYIQSYNRSTSAYLDTAYNAATHAFYTSGTERARIDSDGNLLVGKTTYNDTSTGCSVAPTDGSTGRFAVVGNGGGAGAAYYITNTSGTVQYIVRPNGNVLNLNNSYGAISDAKLKDVIGAAPSYWDKFKQYQFVNYTLKSDEAKTKLLGLVAQQARQVSPGVVAESPDLDADGNDLGTTTLDVKYSVVTLQAEVVLQEAQARIESLEAIIEQLKADVATLKGE